MLCAQEEKLNKTLSAQDENLKETLSAQDEKLDALDAKLERVLP
jgi:hypothetical protein